ncbi:MAG TPA: class I mannose-6-phosphate isomerase [Tepidisphaeraceae bacterium]|jgi:mannose-6-phosphate isomerase class I
MPRSSYDRYPAIAAAPGKQSECWRGWEAICAQIRQTIAAKSENRLIIAVECYTGLRENILVKLAQGLPEVEHFFHTKYVFKSPEEIDRLVAPWLGGNDPLFGHFSTLELADFVDGEKVRQYRQQIESRAEHIIVFGTGALLCCKPDLIIYADMPRWEGQLRQRRGEVSNLGVENRGLKPSLQYKRSFFIDWRICDRLKAATIERWDFLLDTTIANDPKLITGAALRETLDAATRRPFRVVPFFDPAPWGGQWMKKQFDLDPSQPNYGWGFDCVPEENSLLLEFAEGVRVEIPAMNLVLFRPRALLGDSVYQRFGAEFPIRFDFLDTIGGGNLSFQVHPTVEFAQREFGLSYTQDESYYILHAEKNASVFLGTRNGIDSEKMFDALESADRAGEPFPVEKFVNQWPARTHDHFLIPTGTVHCSGAETVVLEISATPYIFTFKLWDWGRLGLDGVPRPTNISRGRQVIQWDRDHDWTHSELINKIQPLENHTDWRSERTGLHPLEFIETHRHWFTDTVPHDTDGSVNVLNLVQGHAALVESPDQLFEPFEVHFAETFIIPAAAGKYTITTLSKAQECATIKAFIRQF